MNSVYRLFGKFFAKTVEIRYLCEKIKDTQE